MIAKKLGPFQRSIGPGIASFSWIKPRAFLYRRRSLLDTTLLRGIEMMSRLTLHRGVFVAALVGSLGLSLTTQSSGQTSQKTTRLEKSTPPRADAKERTSGVILKVEKIAKGAEPGSPIVKETTDHPERRQLLRLTINVCRLLMVQDIKFRDLGTCRSSLPGLRFSNVGWSGINTV